MTDCCSMLRDLADPKYGDRVKNLIDRAAKRTGLSYVRAREIWYGNARRIEQHEYLKIKAAWEQKKSKDEDRKLLNEWHQHRAQMASIEAVLLQKDEEYYREIFAPFKQALGRIC